MGVDEQPRSFVGLQRGCGISQVYAAAFDRLRGGLQPAASSALNAWQDRESVLAQFSQREAEAKEAYRRYIAEGVVLGTRPELVGGSGSVGEWFAVKSQRRRRIEESTDERILGSGAFVERVLKEADARTVRQNAFK